MTDWWCLAPVVYRYAGPPFGGLAEAMAGWMLRDDCPADRATFDPATVVNAFPLTGRRASALPMVVDLLRDELIVVDLCVGSGWRTRSRSTAPRPGG